MLNTLRFDEVVWQKASLILICIIFLLFSGCEPPLSAATTVYGDLEEIINDDTDRTIKFVPVIVPFFSTGVVHSVASTNGLFSTTVEPGYYNVVISPHQFPKLWIPDGENLNLKMIIDGLPPDTFYGPVSIGYSSTNKTNGLMLFNTESYTNFPQIAWYRNDPATNSIAAFLGAYSSNSFYGEGLHVNNRFFFSSTNEDMWIGSSKVITASSLVSSNAALGLDLTNFALAVGLNLTNLNTASSNALYVIFTNLNTVASNNLQSQIDAIVASGGILTLGGFGTNTTISNLLAMGYFTNRAIFYQEGTAVFTNVVDFLNSVYIQTPTVSSNPANKIYVDDQTANLTNFVLSLGLSLTNLNTGTSNVLYAILTNLNTLSSNSLQSQLDALVAGGGILTLGGFGTNTTISNLLTLGTSTNKGSLDQEGVARFTNTATFLSSVFVNSPTVASNPATKAYTDALSFSSFSGGAWENLVFVDAVNGDDGTGVRENPRLAFETITSATSAAIAGDTVVVLPSLYQEVIVAKTNVSYYLAKGTILTNSTTNVIFIGTNGTLNIYGEGIFSVSTNGAFLMRGGGDSYFARNGTTYNATILNVTAETITLSDDPIAGSSLISEFGGSEDIAVNIKCKNLTAWDVINWQNAFVAGGCIEAERFVGGFGNALHSGGFPNFVIKNTFWQCDISSFTEGMLIIEGGAFSTSADFFSDVEFHGTRVADEASVDFIDGTIQGAFYIP